ncbi:MAG: hypothetical protein LBR80_03280 [Deltaproteobacteria bacterium]|jgi:hypothetical protein|nr:hypothetical protein [Deltaproteobacteria bacterium]
MDPDAIRAAILESDTPREMLKRLVELKMMVDFAEALYKVDRVTINDGGDSFRIE